MNARHGHIPVWWGCWESNLEVSVYLRTGEVPKLKTLCLLEVMSTGVG